MYRITCDGQIIFDTRLDDCAVFDPMVNVGTNTVGECTFNVYSSHPHFYDMHLLKSIFEVSDENGVIFRGRMTNNTRDFYNGKAVDLEGLMAFFNDSMVKPFVFPDDFETATESDNIVKYFLNWLIHQHNQQVKPFQQFKLGNVTVSDPNNYISRSSENVASTWQTLKEKLFESSLGGYLCIRYVDVGKLIYYLCDFEDVNTQEIRYGQNMLDVKHEIDASATYSAIIPIGAEIDVESEDGETVKEKLTLESIPDGKLNNSDDTYKITLDNGLHAIYSESALNNYGWICCTVTWDDVTEANNLKNKAREYLLGIAGYASDNIEVTAADLHFSDKEIRSFRIYKKVKVISKAHSIAATYNLTKLSIDLVNPQNTKIVVGAAKDSLTDSISRGGSSGSSGSSGGNGGGGGGGSIVNASSIISALGYTPANKNDVPTKVSDLTNDKGYLDEETDPTVPAWAKQSSKPTYTADEVGADAKGTAESKVTAHNTSTDAHNDIRLLIEELTTRLNVLADSDDVTLDQLSELVEYIKANRTLIEEVTTKKVNVADIVDNLYTNVSDKPLSAAQGVVLKNMFGEIDVPEALFELDDDTEHRLVTDAEKTIWNSKSDFSGSYNDLYDQPFGETWMSSGSDTLTSDDAIYGGYHKVSDMTPTLEQIQNGCEVTYYKVTDGAISGDPIVINDSNAEYSVASSTNGVLIRYDGSPLVIVSYTGIGTFGAVSYPDITSPGVYFRQSEYGCTHSFKLTDYTGFPMKVTKKLDEEWLPDGIVKTVNYIGPDANGNVNVTGGSGGSGIADTAFDIVKSDACTWNGDEEGKVVVTNPVDSSFTYVRVSSVVPAFESLQNGGNWATVDATGMEYVETYASTDIAEHDTVIEFLGGYILIAKEDSVTFESDYANCTFPKAGIYFANFYEEGYVSLLSITGYEGFAKPVLKEECMFDLTHAHDWYGKKITAGNTVLSDDIVHGDFVKVSDAVPTEEELLKGGVLRRYDVADGAISGELIIANYLEGLYDCTTIDEGSLISCDGLPYVVISKNGNPKMGPITFGAITEPGVYFRQDKYACIHSLTINEYTGFAANVETIPGELLPQDYIRQLVEEVVGEMNILITKEA